MNELFGPAISVVVKSGKTRIVRHEEPPTSPWDAVLKSSGSLTVEGLTKQVVAELHVLDPPLSDKKVRSTALELAGQEPPLEGQQLGDFTEAVDLAVKAETSRRAFAAANALFRPTGAIL